MQGHRDLGRRVALGALAALALGASVDAPLDDLASTDPHAVEAAVAAIEHAPADPDALFAAARACEDRLADPVHAAALYERTAREFPAARVALPAQRRGEQLRGELGPHDEYAERATRFAQLVATADTADPDLVETRGDMLVEPPWPGAPDVLLWLGEYLRGHARYTAAQIRYRELARRWPGSPQALEGARDAAGCALDAHDWALAERLATELPGGNPVEDAARTELIAAAHRGRRRDAFDTTATLALLLALAVLVASLADAMRRGGLRWPSPRPPVEVWFLTPIAAVLVTVAWFAQGVIAPAVTRISVAGIACAWLSGATLDLMRTRGRATRGRSLVHAVACLLVAISVAYLSISRDGLLDMFAETARYGPEP